MPRKTCSLPGFSIPRTSSATKTRFQPAFHAGNRFPNSERRATFIVSGGPAPGQCWFSLPSSRHAFHPVVA